MNEHAESADKAFSPEACARREASVQPFRPLQGILPDGLMANDETLAYLRRIEAEIVGNQVAVSNFWLESLKQSDAMLVSWMDTQRQLGDSWYQAVIGHLSPVQDPAAGRAEDVLEGWLDAASKAVHLQNEWLGLWTSMMIGNRDSGASHDAETGSPLSASRKSARSEEVA